MPSVQFKVNGTNLGSPVTQAPYRIKWTPSSGGSYTITYEITEDSGAKRTSVPKTVSVKPPENQVPTITVTTATSGTAGTPQTITATAGDSDGTIASVQFRIDGSNLGAPVTQAPYTTSWTPTTAGNYSVTAIATDNAGLTKVSAAIAVTVASATPVAPNPTITVTAPKAGLVSEAQVLMAAASVTGDTIASVQFQVNTVNEGAADTASPYTISWTPATKGAYGIRGIATGALGGSTTSASVNVLICDTKVTSEGSGVSLAANTGDYVLFDNNQAAGGLPASADLFVGAEQVAVLNYLSDAYNSKPFAFFRASNSTLYTGIIASGTVTLNG